MANRHARGYGMRVDDQVRTNSFLSEWHVFLPVGHPDSSFLSMTRSELVSYLRDPNRAHLNLGEPISVLVGRQDDLLNHAFLRVLQLCGAVLARL